MNNLTELALSHRLLDDEQQDTTHALAQALYERGDITQALDVFRLLALCAPMRARSWFSVAVCHEALGDEERAASLYELSVEVGGDHEFVVLAAIRGAKLLCDLDEVDRASEVLDRVDDLDPSVAGQLAALRSRVAVRRAS
jgi:tetratricopeptide (TPR) repeat protein